MALNALDAVKRVAPRAAQNYLLALRDGAALFERHGITTGLRMAHFLAQALHETGGFTVLRENMNYGSASRLFEIFGVNRHSAALTRDEAQRLAGHPEEIAERVYGLGNARKSRELGNLQPGDGFKFRGNGVLQTTGRLHHRRLGNACGVDFESHPDLVTAPEHALKPALQEWSEGGLNALADRNDLRGITRRINGGFNGFEDRQLWFDKLWPLFKDPAAPSEAWAAADADEQVRQLQTALNDLGADPRLEVDGRYGPATRRAVREFQAVAGLDVDGIAGPLTRAQIEMRLAVTRGGQ
ncbi:peptidoglycan-binding protein [Azohydromonas lata]|uniref:peptidoglycan-binding protein n=1 Tax=Azohydromonas lata TaxID=45677 RepID=UPI00082CED5B|nr:peptidoglycan-binding protein [Azohydromonas lata]